MCTKGPSIAPAPREGGILWGPHLTMRPLLAFADKVKGRQQGVKLLGGAQRQVHLGLARVGFLKVAGELGVVVAQAGIRLLQLAYQGLEALVLVRQPLGLHR